MTTPRVKVFAHQVWPVPPSQDDLQASQMLIETLVEYFIRRGTISDADNQCLRYETDDGDIALQEDDDLRNAIRFARNREQNRLCIFVKSQDELG